MNPRQQLFVAEYMIDRNATKAALRSGYSERRAQQTGSRLVHLPPIAAAIRKADTARREKLGIDADWIVSKLVEVHEKALAGAPKTDREGRAVLVDGEQIFEWSPGGATRPLELLMKHLGISGVEKHEVTVSGGPVVYTLKLDRELPEDDE